MNKVTIEITKSESKIIAEIDGQTFVNTYYKKSRGIWRTKEKAIEDQIEESGIDVPYEFVEALMDFDGIDLMRALELFDENECDFED